MIRSIGGTLRQAREEKQISLEVAAQETNISAHHLTALEEENFDSFPAEAYLLGFLRNYSEFLGLQPDKMIGMYRNFLKSEEPAPIEQLVGANERKSIRWILPLILILAAVAAVFFLYPRFEVYLDERQKQMEQDRIEAEQAIPQTWKVSETISTVQFSSGDSLLVDLASGETLLNASLDDNTAVFVLNNEAGETLKHTLRLGEEVFIPVNGTQPEVRLFLKDINLPDGDAAVEVQILELPQILEEAGDLDGNLSEIPHSEGVSEAKERILKPILIETAAEKSKFTIDIIFRGFTLFRYKADGNPVTEKYFKETDRLRLDVFREVSLGMSNAKVVYARVNGKEIRLGQSGVVVLGNIKWMNNENGQFDLYFIPGN